MTLLLAMFCLLVPPIQAQEIGWNNLWVRIGDRFLGSHDIYETPQFISQENVLPLTLVIELEAGAYDTAELRVYETHDFTQDVLEAEELHGIPQSKVLWQTAKMPATSARSVFDSTRYTPTLPPHEPRLFFFELVVRDGEDVKKYTRELHVVYTGERFVYTNYSYGLISLYQNALKLEHGYALDLSIPEIGTRNPKLALRLYRLEQLQQRNPAQIAADRANKTVELKERVFKYRGFDMRRVITGAERDSVCTSKGIYAGCIAIYPWESEYVYADSLRERALDAIRRYHRRQ